MTNSLHPALELRNGKPVGRDPRKMSPASLAEAGHNNRSALKAIAANCLDCCAGKADEVRACVSHQCPLWAFRMGTNPLDRRNLSEEQRQAAADRMALVRAA